MDFRCSYFIFCGQFLFALYALKAAFILFYDGIIFKLENKITLFVGFHGFWSIGIISVSS